MLAEEAIVLAGGLGTRLRPLVSELPKPLAPVAGRPFLAWVLDHLASNGMRRVVLATGYMAEKVESAIGRNWLGMEIAYSIEQVPLGTGGAIRQALSHLQGGAVHVVNGDTYLHYSLRNLEGATVEANAIAGVALAEVADVFRYGAVEVSAGRISEFRGKGGFGAGWINAGSYFLTEAALRALPAKPPFSLEADFLHPQADAASLAAFTETSGFIDIGVPEDYARAQEFLPRAS